LQPNSQNRTPLSVKRENRINTLNTINESRSKDITPIKVEKETILKSQIKENLEDDEEYMTNKEEIIANFLRSKIKPPDEEEFKIEIRKEEIPYDLEQNNPIMDGNRLDSSPDISQQLFENSSKFLKNDNILYISNEDYKIIDFMPDFASKLELFPWPYDKYLDNIEIDDK
jgi:hypothetical protein